MPHDSFFYSPFVDEGSNNCTAFPVSLSPSSTLKRENRAVNPVRIRVYGSFLQMKLLYVGPAMKFGVNHFLSESDPTGRRSGSRWSHSADNR